MFESIQVILSSLPSLLAGAVLTIQLTILSATVGMIGGSLMALAYLSPAAPLRWFARIYIDFFRGTPLLVQLFMIYFGLPVLFGDTFGISLGLDKFTAGVIALGLNSAAYIAEIMRAGIQSIDLGQSEASASLGLSSVQTLRHVVFPQALRRMLPPLGNEFITMLKDTSLVAVISLEELLRKGQLIVAVNYKSFQIYLAVALIYLVLTIITSRLFSFLEDWMNPIKRSQKATNQPANS